MYTAKYLSIIVIEIYIYIYTYTSCIYSYDYMYLLNYMYTKICMTTFFMDLRILDFPQAGCLKCSSTPIGDARIFLTKKHDFLGGRVYKNYHPKTNSYVSHDYFNRKLHLLTIYFQGLCLVLGGVLFVLLVALFFGSLPNRL